MTKYTKLIVTTSLIIASPVILAAINPADLVKVTGETKIKCVEYYSYKGEEYCSTKALQKPVDAEVKNYETQVIVFDERPWQAAWGKKADNIVTVEYVPMGDDINNWNELVTSQFFPGIQDKTTPKDFADTVINGMKEAGYKPDVTFHKIKPDEVIFEFKITEPSSQIQDELQSIRKGPDGIYVLHYVIKQKDMGAGKRREWLENIVHSTIKSS